MSALAASLDLEIIWLLVIVLIGIVSAVRGFIQRRMLEQQRVERGGKPLPPVATQVRQEVLKYLGEIRPEPEKPAGPEELAAGHAEAAGRAERASAERPTVELELRPVPPTPPAITFPKKREPTTIVRRRVIRRRVRQKAPEPEPTRGRPALATREELRNAILYREILGPPVAMRRMGRSLSKLPRR